MPRVPINDVTPTKPEKNLRDGKAQALAVDPQAECFSHLDSEFLAVQKDMNPLVVAVMLAFNNHIPLELSPDAIFNTILQGASAHVATDPERFRSVFVSHAGKKTLKTRNDSLVRGNWHNDWSTSINDIGGQILQDMSGGSAKAVLATKFSTTTLAEATGHIAVFMDVVKNYYAYEFHTMCGIPYVDLTGTRQDWVDLGQSLGPLLAELALDDWNRELQEILQHFVDAFDGKVDAEFWKQIFYYHDVDGSGTVAKVTGWIAKFFLYLVKGVKNPHLNSVPHCPMLDPSNRSPFDNAPPMAVPPTKFPAGRTSTLFKWVYHGEELEMKLMGGLIGVSITPGGALRPEVGWIVAGTENKGK